MSYSIDTRPANQIAKNLLKTVSNNGKIYVSCLNPHSYSVARNNKLFSEALKNAHSLLADGIGISIALTLITGRSIPRCTGSQIFNEVNKSLNEQMGSVFFIGSSDENLYDLVSKFATEFPQIVIKGSYSPAYNYEISEKDTNCIRKKLALCKPDVVWVGLGSPKQDLWIFKNIDTLEAKLFLAIGAVFDFYTGNIKRPPILFQKVGLEWFGRLLIEPKRLWKRTFLSGPIFIFDFILFLLRKINGSKDLV